MPRKTTKQTREEMTTARRDAKANRRASLAFYDKYMLTVEEAVIYFHIGGKKMSQILKDNPKAKWILMNGKRTLIKKDMFAMWLDEQSEI